MVTSAMVPRRALDSPGSARVTSLARQTYRVGKRGSNRETVRAVRMIVRKLRLIASPARA
jgi:hypothetical protein